MEWRTDDPDRYELRLDDDLFYRRVLEHFERHQIVFHWVRPDPAPGPPFRDWSELKNACLNTHRLLWQRDCELANICLNARSERLRRAYGICLAYHRAGYDTGASRSIMLLLELGGYDRADIELEFEAARREWRRLARTIAHSPVAVAADQRLASRFRWWTTRVRYFRGINVAVQASHALEQRLSTAARGIPVIIH